MGATFGEEVYRETVELPVRPPAPRVVLAQSGKITEGTPLRIDPRGEFLEGTIRGELLLSPFPDLNLGPSLQYLIRYPYGCLEQTTSKVFPLVYLRDLVERLQLNVESSGETSKVSEERLLDIEQFVLAVIAGRTASSGSTQ